MSKHSTDKKTFEMCRPESAGMSSRALSFIDDVMERSIREKVMKGMVTLVARHGKIVHFKAYGEAREGVRMKKDAIFRYASMSKTIGAAALMQLYDRGLVMPSDLLSDYIPAFAGCKVAEACEDGSIQLVPARREITVHDLLTMTSGIASIRDLELEDPAAAYCAKCYKEAGIDDSVIALDTTIGQMADRLAGLPLASHPGDRWDYSNLSSIVLGRVVEIVSGTDLDSYLKKYIFNPLNMKDTSFYPDRSKWDRIPDVFACGSMELLKEMDVPGTGDTRVPFTDYKNYYNISAGLTGTALDYFQFAQMLCDRGVRNGKRILSPHAVSLMTMPYTRHAGPSIYGHTWGYMMDVQSQVNTTFNYMGNGSYGWHGYWGSVFNVWPDRDMVAVFLSQVSPVGLSWKTQERFLNVAACAVKEV